MGLRELLILVLILAIVGVIVRGLYVALRARRGQLRMALEKNIPQYDPDEIALSELPNGGARMVERSFAHVVRQNSEFSSRDKLGSLRDKIAKGDQAIPVLMDSVGEDDEDEVVSPVRASSVATARNAARERHSTLGSKTVVTPKPTHRPIDVMPARTAPLAAAASAPAAFAADVGSAGDESNRTYDDPLDSHVFKDDDLIAYDDREEWPETDAEDDDDYDDDRLDDDRLDDDEMEDDLEDDQYEDDLDGDNDYDDEDEDEDEDEVEVEDDELDAEDLEAEEFESVYGSDREERSMDADDDDYDEFDDEVDDLDDYPEEDEEAKSGPRRWLQWAGDKISGMTSAAVSRGEREREKDATDRKHNADRAEPMIGGNSFDDSMMEESVPAPRPALAPTPRSRPEPLHESRQSELFGDSSFNANDDYEEDVAPARESRTGTASRAKSAETSAKTPAKTEAAPVDYSEVLVLNVVAKPDREFVGVDLLPVLLTTGLRFGDMSIFHRHLDNDARSPVLFSVANIVNPGTFDLNQINEFATRGLCFFMTLPNVANSMQAFDLMLDVAQKVRIAMDGDLKDDNRSVMTAQTIEHYRQRVRDFDLRQMRQQK